MNKISCGAHETYSAIDAVISIIFEARPEFNA